MERHAEGMNGLSGVVVHNGIAHIVAFDWDKGADIATQTEATLAYLDRLLAKAGSDRTNLIQCTVYLAEITDKPAMDRVWRVWIGGAENWPQRACVGVSLPEGTLIEVVATAAVRS